MGVSSVDELILKEFIFSHVVQVFFLIS